ncbi:hypothetical protein Ddc_16559 [Ditylenchus destructor]|nr:hypothetical protein Ddc_16559 [Ditylenchus destructor]
MVFSRVFVISLMIFCVYFVASQDSESNLTESEVSRRNLFFYACCLDEARKNATEIYRPAEHELEPYCSYTWRIKQYQDVVDVEGTIPPKGNETMFDWRPFLKDVYACESNKKNATECCIKRNVASNCLRDCDGTSKANASDCMPKDKVSIIKCFQEVAYTDWCPQVPASPPASPPAGPPASSPASPPVSHNETASTEGNSATNHQIAYVLNFFAIILFTLRL